PANPQNPPTFADITNVKEYVEHLVYSKKSTLPHAANDNDIGAAEQYEHEVVLASSLAGIWVAPPPWLGPFTNNFNQLLQNMNQMQISINQVQISLQHVEPRQENARIGRFNHLELTHNTGVTTYQAKQKEVIGNGIALANTVSLPNAAPMAPLLPIPAIGATFAPTINIHTLNHHAILQLIQFYNQSFGIQICDTVPVRSQKIANWLTTDI
ncbi:hypothetical protein L208DRAFT_1230424, partial [Tricholoma matsutake]